ncbi:hypothetical protein CHUAL_001813 [Chamberlinius hualienensis]
MESKCPDLDFITRRNIFSLKPGTQIPGYTGHRPGIRFGFGSTYGDLTHQLKNFDMIDGPSSFTENQRKEWFDGNDCSPPQSDRKPTYQNPKNNSSAMAKLLKGLEVNDEDLQQDHWPIVDFKMIPPTGLKSGYTGYVPRLRYHFGSSYSQSSNEAKEEFSYLQQIDRGDQTDADSSLDAILFAKYGEQLQKPLIPVNDNEKVLEELLKFQKQQQLDFQENSPKSTATHQGYIPRSLQTLSHTGRRSEMSNKCHDVHVDPVHYHDSCFM